MLTKIIIRVWNSVRIRTWHFFSPSRRVAQLQELYVRFWRAPLPIRKKPVLGDFQMLFMTGRRHLKYLHYCLNSIAVVWEQLPAVVVVSDGSIVMEQIRKSLSFYPALTIVSINDILAKYEADIDENILRFARCHILGKKLAAILHYGAITPTLWCDSDVLWFRTLNQSHFANLQSKAIGLTEDILPSYDLKLLRFNPQLMKPPFYNSGLVYLDADFRRDPVVTHLAELAAQAPHHFSEQTILAILASGKGAPVWSLEEIYISNHDEHRIPITPTFAGKPWLARHYARALKQFWRDVIALNNIGRS